MSDEIIKDSDKGSRASLIGFLLVFAFFCLFTLKLIQPYLLALVMGGILAIVSWPAYRRLRLRKIGSKTAALVVTFLLILLVVAPLLTFSFMAIKQGISFGHDLAEGQHFSIDGIVSKISSFTPLSWIFPDTGELEAQIKVVLSTLANSTSAQILGMAKSIPDAVLQLALASMACFFFLADGRAFIKWVSERLPLDLDIRNKLAATLKDTAISVVWASMAAAGTQAAIMSVAFAALGLPGAFLAGGATFILAWIPILGSTPVWLTGVAVLYSYGAMGKVVALILIGGFTGVIDNFVRPYILKGRGEMHPLVSLVAIFGGIQMFGLFGVLLGPILMAVVLSLLQIWPVVGKRFGIRFDASTRNE